MDDAIGKEGSFLWQVLNNLRLVVSPSAASLHVLMTGAMLLLGNKTHCANVHMSAL